jgi:hypothetical protein
MNRVCLGRLSSPGIVVSLALLILLPIAASAALGDNEQSVVGDQARLKGTHRLIRGPKYSVHEISTPAGHVVHEFLSPSGTVFAVSWQGPALVDLHTLLGSYFEQYTQVVASRPPSPEAPTNINVPGLVFQQSGHMRAFRGRAYVPSLIPQGVDPGEIR